MRDQATDSVAGHVGTDGEGAVVQGSVKAGGSSWSVAAWVQWAQAKWRGQGDLSAGVGGEKRW